MVETAEHLHPIVDITQAGEMIRQLHDQVCGNRQRVHITRSDSDDACVMISRAELESLERAVAIFADTQEFGEMCRMLAKILKASGDVYAPAGAGNFAQV